MLQSYMTLLPFLHVAIWPHSQLVPLRRIWSLSADVGIGGLVSNRLIFDRDSDSRIPLPLFADLEQDSNVEGILLSINNPRSPICRFTPLENNGTPAKSTSGIYHPLPGASTFRVLEILAGEDDVVQSFSGVCAVVNDWLAQAGQEALEATYSELSKYDDSTVYRANINDGEDSRSYMMQLFRRRWFSRMWVLQEAVLARHALVQLGSYQIPWEWVGLAAAILVHKPELSPSGFGRDMIPTGAMNGYLMYRLSVSQKCFPRLEFSFAQLLQVSRYFQSKEPKDKVYGLLGIETTDSVGRQIVPDYRETINSEKVFEDIARLMLESANPLTFLSGAGTFGDYDRSRPSWVPSWHKRRPWTILPTKQDQGFQCASASRMEMRSDHKEGELVLKGVIVDQITSMQEHRDYWGIFDENDKSRNNLLNQPRWSTEAWRKCAMILTCGGDGRAYPIDDEATNLADLAALVLSRSAHWVIRDLIALRDVIEPEDDEMTQAEYLAEIAEGGNARRYISAVEPVRNSYRLFKTASKDFGVGPVDMKIGDKLCVLFGAEVPFLLRPKGDGYLVIGECYVYNLMHGEILEKLTADPEGQLKAEWIKLI
ncbi:unnamed protein product [Fusarium fujikuroi]|uniref:Heterokaryon incompatibility domain-containing protein n=1 Tax=Fusarium fujikuroi TaxID=5127 RepID=A0A9Q9S008_FUSFU|nr:unnamed protein product [Fusarium fujikuroi]